MENTVEYRNRASFWQLLGFAGNNAATNSLFVLLGGYFIVYGTNVYLISAALLGTVAMVTRLFDAVTDPIIGVMVDKTNTKLGRFRPYMIAGSLISNVLFLVIFSGQDFGSKGLNLAFLIAMYVIWVIGYTFQTSISKAGQNVLTSDPKQRTTLNAISGLMTMVVFITGLMLWPSMVEARGADIAQNWFDLAVIMVGMQLFFTLIAVIGIWKKDVPENYMIQTSDSKPSIKEYISLFKGNKALQMLVVAASTNKFAMTIGQGLLVMFYFYVVGDSDMQTKVTPTGIIFMLLATFTVLVYTNKVGRKKAFRNTSFAAMIWGVVAIFIVAVQPSSFIVLVLVLGVNAYLVGGTDLNVIPMIADATDYENYKTGRFIPGMIGTSFSFIDKVISSFGSLFLGLLLTGLGYVSFEETPANPTLFWGILIAYFLFPALGHLASVIAMKHYPLDNETMSKMSIELEKRRSEEV